MEQTQHLCSRVKTLFERELKVSIPSVEVDLIEHQYIDSLRFVDLILAIENEFEFQLPLDDLDLNMFKTVATTAQLIAQQTAQ